MRDIDPDLIAYFKTRRPYKYAHLIKFERPILAPDDSEVDSNKEYVYLTDASTDQYFQDPHTDDSIENMSIKYRANKVLEVPGITEYSEARATSIDLSLDASAIGTYLSGDVLITQSGSFYDIEFSYDVYDKGFVEGDKLQILVDGYQYSLDLVKVPKDNVLRVEAETLPLGSVTVYLELASKELISILQDKTSPEYANFVNREVLIHKIFLILRTSI